MKSMILAFGLVLAYASTVGAQDATWPPAKQKESEFTGRKLDTYQHGIKKEWGYAAAQRDTFLVLHPKEVKANSPLYVVLHSAGHDVHSCLACTTKVGNHDIYHSPPDFFALYVDCRANKGDWWWGINKYPGPEVCPTEKRILDTVQWVIKQYGIDENRVYLCGNSMGGSGTLGIGMRHGDVFAAIKANVPAEVKHVSNRMYFPPAKMPADLRLPDPPVAIDYSAQNDSWSRGHDDFVKTMNERKYSLILYWGPFGHANNHASIKKVNDLIDSFDWLSTKKNESYPVFTNASSNDSIPWPNQLNDKKSGQINAFFRWKNERDAADAIETTLFLVKPSELKTSFKIPTEATADITLRRLQKFQIAPGAKVRWRFGVASGEVAADAAGSITIAQLKITDEPTKLTIEKANATGAVKDSGLSVKVMTFNIRYGTAKDGEDHWDKRKAFLAETIKAFAPDLLGTQETLGFQRDYLSQQLPMLSVFAAGRDDGKEKGEMAALYWRKERFEKLDGGHFWLSETPDKVGSKGWDAALSRLATWVKLRDRLAPEAKPVLFINTHFDHKGKKARVESSKLLRERMEKLGQGCSVILTGDFNSGEDTDAYQALFAKQGDRDSLIVDAFRIAHPKRDKNEGTFNAFKAASTTGARIDWIGTSRDWSVKSARIDYTTKEGRTPSDHFPVVAEVQR